jgi:hypothetical protein
VIDRAICVTCYDLCAPELRRTQTKSPASRV